MSYSLKRKNNYKVLYAYKIIGFVVEPSKGNTKYNVSASKVVLMDEKLINQYIIKSVNRKFEKLFQKMYQILTDDEDDSDSAPLILDEIAKLKSIVINKYKEHISEETYKDILKKLLIAEDEFAKSYNEKLYYQQMRYYDYDYNNELQESRGKSR